MVVPMFCTYYLGIAYSGHLDTEHVGITDCGRVTGHGRIFHDWRSRAGCCYLPCWMGFGFGQVQSHYFLLFWNWSGVIFSVRGILSWSGVVAHDGLDIMGRVVVVVVTGVEGIMVVDTWRSTRGFSINLTSKCLLSAWWFMILLLVPFVTLLLEAYAFWCDGVLGLLV